MQVEEKRACASCGSGNPPDAGFCWRCLVPLGQMPPPPDAVSRVAGQSVPPPAHVPRSSQEPSTSAKSSTGAVVAEGSAKSGTRRGSDYRCVSAVAGAETAVACMWRDDDNVGIVLEASPDLRGTRQLLWTVHDMIVG